MPKRLKSSQRKFVIVFVLIVTGAVFLLSQKFATNLAQQQIDIEIVLTDQGFEPDIIVVPVGTSVIFSTTTNEFFWPASENHPDHLVYPEFDSGAPIGPKQTWEFTFDKPGMWEYHNHLGSNYSSDVGLVVVQAADEPRFDPTSLYSVEYCKSVEPATQVRCWKRYFRWLTRTYGVKHAFEVLSHVYETYKPFVPTCNDVTHHIGGQAYGRYIGKLEEVLTPETVFCNAGFYHGFMEVFVSSTRDVSRAASFCEYIEERMGNLTILASHGCYHGIGHGIMETLGVHTLGDWEQAAVLLEETDQICSQFETRRYRSCVNGAFNATVVHMLTSTDAVERSEESPYWLCPLLDEEFLKKNCYEAMTPFVVQAHSSFRDIIGTITPLVPDAYFDQALHNATQGWAYSVAAADNWSEEIAVCDGLPDARSSLCLDMFVKSLIDNGEPGAEYRNGLRFCGDSRLDDVQREHCEMTVAQYATEYYSHGDPGEVCSMMPEAVKQFCGGEHQ